MELVLILHYMGGDGTPKWWARAFCQSPKEMADFITENLDELRLDLAEDDYYSIEQRVGIYNRHDICDGDLETLIEIMQSL